jgi:predicted ATP-grasp superfamily ATP-dependent carboligase
MINVLVFPAVGNNAIELHNALSTCVNIKCWGGVSAQIDRHGSYVFENYVMGLPMITESNFFEELNKLIEEKNIEVIFPTHDTVANLFASNKDKINAKVVVSDKRTAEICRDKKLTYQCFKGESFIPTIYKDIKDVDKYPVFVKPKQGQGSVGAKRLASFEDVANIDLSDYVICEYLPGEEYTVDCFTDKDGNLLLVSPRSRQRLLAGVTVEGITEELTEEIKNIAETINHKLSFVGLWYFQIKKDSKNKWKLMEISTRCAGTMCLTRARGVNLPLLSVYTIMGYDVSVNPNPYKVKVDRTLISRYKIDYEYDTVYFDFDDTLIVREKINLYAIWFLYQCQNNNKRIILLTKHEKELKESMRKYNICPDLFSEIIHIEPNEKKSKYIKHEKSIFVDNAFQERKDVYDNCHIPVFDVEGIEVLMDYRQ